MEHYGPGDRFAACYPADPEWVRVIREEVAAIASECGMDAAAVADVRLAVSEVASNAVLHAYPGAAGEIRVRAVYDAERLVITITDDGLGMVPRIDSPG